MLCCRELGEGRGREGGVGKEEEEEEVAAADVAFLNNCPH